MNYRPGCSSKASLVDGERRVPPAFCQAKICYFASGIEEQGMLI